MDNNQLDTVVQEPVTTEASEKISLRNLIMFPLGTLGRDFLYNFFNGYLITFILFTKSLTPAQFGSITFIIVAARIFDAFNDPIMGGIVENTRTKWGRYKPWQLIGGILTSIVVIILFNVNLDGWAFIGFLAFAYFLFSITFTMNDISYWGMMPTLTNNPMDRDKLMSFAQIIASIGGGLAGILVPALTTGAIGAAVFGSAVTGYKVLSVVVGVMMIGFQFFTIFGVQEKPLDLKLAKQPAMKLTDMFKVLFKNDQLLWAALTMLLFNIGPNLFINGVGMMYSYLEFGYDGLMFTVFCAGYSVVSVAFTLFYPWISKKWGRDKVLYSTGIAIIAGFALMFIFGMTIPQIHLFTIPLINFKLNLKFLMMFLAYTLVGWGSGFYLISVINITNTVEYNEFKTGDRKEGLIFSLRPFTAKMGSAIVQGLMSLIYIIAGILTVTNGISDLENQAAKGLDATVKLEKINALIDSVSLSSKRILLSCMCIIPMVIMAISLIIYKTKFKLDEKTMSYMIEEIAKRKGAETSDESAEEIYEDAIEAIEDAEHDAEVAAIEAQEAAIEEAIEAEEAAEEEDASEFAEGPVETPEEEPEE